MCCVGKGKRQQGKVFAGLRVGIRDHRALFGTNPDAWTVYSLYFHVEAPIFGPDIGIVPLYQSELARELGWSRQRLSRAMKWLACKPSQQRPYLVRIKGATRGSAARYYIRNFTGTEPSRCNAYGIVENEPCYGDGKVNASTIRSDVAEMGKCPPVVSSDVTDVGTINPYRRARQKTQISEERDGGYAMNSDERQDLGRSAAEHDYVIVGNAAEARAALLRGPFAGLPDHMHDEILGNAMKKLHRYHIAIREPEAATGTDGEPEWKDPWE